MTETVRVQNALPPARVPARVNTTALMMAAMLVIGVANVLWAERLTINRGFGWDGVAYAAWARDFYEIVFVQHLPAYYTQRILPSAVVHYALRLAGAPPTDANILLGFDLYNLALLLLSVYVWGLMADKLRIRDHGKWLGFCFLFLNYAILKHGFYHSVLTDTTAFCLGLLAIYCFFAEKPLGLLALMVAGAFTWPTVPYMAALLYVLPRTASDTRGMQSAGAASRYNVVAAAAITAGVAAMLVFLIAAGFIDKFTAAGRGLRVDMPLLYASVAAVLTYVFVTLKDALDDSRLFDIRRVAAAVRWDRLAIAVAVLGATRLAVWALSNGVVAVWTIHGFVEYTLLAALTEPLIFLVAHAVYYGPPVILLVLLWRRVCGSIGEFGLGFRLVFIANLIMSINPQSRFQINALAVFIVPLVRLMDRQTVGVRAIVLWAAVCVACSKVWYVFNTAPQVDDGTMNALQTFPLQHLFMSSGPWMSHGMYLVHATIALVLGVLLYVIVRRMPETTFDRARRAEPT